MNFLTSQTRKWVYLAGIILLLIPVIVLGRPSAPGSAAQPEGDPGGTLAQIRTEYDLGESTLGQVDPSSSTMNLVLLGLRGVAADILALKLDEYKDTKNWAQLRATTESIILLQPHFQKVWEYHGWNLAYNVSAEWDAVPDRYYWVKEGAKFFRRGTERNKKYPELYWYTGNTLGKKIGRSDEKVQFRRYFHKDPDPAVYRPDKEGPDRSINPEDKDNYQVAEEWFRLSNKIMDQYGKEEHIMAPILFRSYPARAIFDYASALQTDGIFDEVTRQAWEEGFKFWTEVYGKEKYPSEAGMVQLESTDEDLPLEGGDKDIQLNLRKWVLKYQDMANYRYWRTRGLAEGKNNTVEAHREIYLGHGKLLEGDSIEAEKLTYSGMEKFDKMLAAYPDLNVDDETIEEGIMAQLTWRDCLTINGGKVPPHFPLERLWNENQNRLERIKEQHARSFRPDH